MEGKNFIKPKGVSLLHLSLLLFTFLVGCRTSQYFNVDNWYVRNNAVPRYFAYYDVFYMHPDRYDGEVISIERRDFTVKHVSELFGKRIRVFAPLCRDQQDVREAIDWYLDNYQGDGFPYIIIAEGEGEKMIKPLVKDLDKEYLVACHWGELNSNTVHEISEDIREWKFKREWGTREVEPDDE